MEEPRPRRLEPIPPYQLALLGAVIVVLVVVVASASRPGDLGPASPPAPAEAGAALLRALVVLALLFEMGVLALIAWALLPLRRGNRRWISSGRWPYALASFLQAAAVMVLLWLYVHFHQGSSGGRTSLLSGIAIHSPGSLIPDRPGGLTQGDVVASGALVAAVLLVLAALGLRWRLRQRDHRRSPLAALSRRLELAAEEGIEELEEEPDPRRAVVAAYARMERTLAGAGWPRRSSETALEYLARLLELVAPGSAAAGRLTELFQVAKFSDHVIGEDMKGEAIACLGAIRDDLRDARLRAEGAEAPAPAPA